jgi:hypothetical protein
MVLVLNQFIEYKYNGSTTYRDLLRVTYFYTTFNDKDGIYEITIDKELEELWRNTSS